MNDTHPHFEKEYNNMLRSRSGEERLKMGCSMHATAIKIARASFLNKDPQATENSIRQELFLRFYANDLDSATKKKILQAIQTYSPSK